MQRFLWLSLIILSANFLSAHEHEGLVGEYLFKSILKVDDTTGVNLKPIGEGDYFNLYQEGKFDYEISAAGLKAAGTWMLDDSLLTLNYSSPFDTTRYYIISKRADVLVLNENGVN